MTRKRNKYNDDDERTTTLADPQLERALLVAILSHVNSTGYTMALQNTLSDDDFVDEQHRLVWQWCKGCADKGQEVNLLNLFGIASEQGKAVDLSRYVQVHGADGDIITLAGALHTMGIKRRISEGVKEVMMAIEHDPEYMPSDALSDMERVVNDTTMTIAPKTEVWRNVYADILKVTERRAKGEVAQGTMTGFDLIDRKGGMERGELMIIAGRNSNGKTSFALCCAVGVAQRGTPVGIFSLEMTNAQLGTRIASILSGINGEAIKKGELNTEQWEGLVNVDDSLPIHFDKQRSADIDTLIGNIKAMVAQKGVKVVVIDYLQLLRGKERERVQMIGGIAHRLEALSTELEITIVLLSQLRRNIDKDPTPRMEELKESGDIADAADSIYLVYRPERHGVDCRYPDMSQNWSQVDTHGTALLMCVKNRNGAMDAEQMLAFDASTTRFYQRESYKPAERLATDYETPF
jgi:replicative DNA helicase